MRGKATQSHPRAAIKRPEPWRSEAKPILSKPAWNRLRPEPCLRFGFANLLQTGLQDTTALPLSRCQNGCRVVAGGAFALATPGTTTLPLHFLLILISMQLITTPPINRNKKKKPNYINKMPIPCSSFKTKVMIFCKM